MTLSPKTEADLDEGLALFNEQKWWEAHEAWERAWLEEEDDLKLFIQGMIQFAAALHKGHNMGSPSGASRLFAAAKDKLSREVYRPSYAGFEIAGVLDALERCFSDAAAVWRGERAAMDRSLAPRITR